MEGLKHYCHFIFINMLSNSVFLYTMNTFYSIFCTIRYTYLKKIFNLFLEEIKYFLKKKKSHFLLFSRRAPASELNPHQVAHLNASVRGIYLKTRFTVLLCKKHLTLLL